MDETTTDATATTTDTTTDATTDSITTSGEVPSSASSSDDGLAASGDLPSDESADTHDTDVSPVEFVCDREQVGDGPFITCVESFWPEGASFGHDQLPDVIQGPPQAGPAGSGGLDVAALGCGGAMTVFFADPGIVDGPGPDFIVFENAFTVGQTTFIEPARVLVSADGLDWRAFPCDPVHDDLPIGCAGLTPVLSHPDNGIDPTDPALAGGDAFDLADVGLEVAHYVRLLDVSVAYHGDRMWCAGSAGGFDLDAIAAIHVP